jgi:hypothetical protein
MVLRPRRTGLCTDPEFIALGFSDVQRLTASEMCRVARVLYDYLDVEQFADLLERMGR